MLSDDLLELQRLDTTADQLGHRRSHLDERAVAAAATEDLRTLNARRDAIDVRSAELDAAIEGLEHEGAQLTEHRARLQAQLKTVIAPREAEALMHELEALASRRDGLDDQELAHLEEQGGLATERVALDARQQDVEARAARTGDELARVEASIDEELGGLHSARGALAATLDAATIERYGRLRARHGGVAIARLEGARCTGCHLDLSRGELDEVRAAGAGSLSDCPQCGRILVP